jgi:hypothetical protein
MIASCHNDALHMLRAWRTCLSGTQNTQSLVLTVTLSARSTCCHDAYFARVPDRPDGWCRQQAAQSMHAFVLGEYEKNAQPLSRSQRSLQAAGVSNNDA